MPSPTVTLDYEQPSFLANSVFGELININCLNALIESDYLQENYDANNYSSKLASQYYQNEKEQLKAYKRLYNKKELVFAVKYGLPRHTLGRVSPYKALGITGFSRRIRNTLIKDYYRDLDLSNAQPYILYNICKNNGMEDDCHFLNQLIHDREKILENVMTTYSVPRKKAKQLFLRLAFYGTFYGWLKENCLNLNFKPNDFIVGLTGELQTIAIKIKIANKALYEKVRKINPDKTNLLGSFMAFYLQTYELHILNAMCEFLCNETTLCNIETSILKILTYEYDGIKLLKENVDSYGVEKLCRDLEQIVLEKTGFVIVLEEKEIDDFYEIEFDSNIDSVKEDETSYEFMKKEFELQHAKIINKSIFIKEHNNKISFLKREELKTAYEHLSFEEPIYDKDGSIKFMKNKSFITEWLKDKNMRRFDDMGVFPPPLICPDNIFNMWLPFSMELIDDFTIDKITLDGFDAILEHIKLLCGYNDEVYDYFIKWMAQMVQFPAIKTICPILISSEGAGKGTLLRIIERMFGTDLLLETTDPLRDVFGSFNELMVGKFVVNLNEVAKKDTSEVIGKVKGLVTDGNLSINSKGVKKFVIPSYHRFIMTTNNEDPITTKKGDRRNLIIRSSDKKCGDKDYFKLLNSYIDNINVLKMFYEFLKGVPDMKDFGSLTMPITEYQESLQEQSVSPIEQWLKHFCITHQEKESIEMIGIETYNLFHNWCQENNIKYECNTTTLVIKLCLLQTSGKIDGIENGKHTKKGNTKIFNIVKLKKHFGIGCLIDFQSQLNQIEEE